jgi:hypothetical protein
LPALSATYILGSDSVTQLALHERTWGRYREMNYDENWRDLRSRIRLFWFVWLSGVPLIALVAAALDRILPKIANQTGVGLVIAWMVAFVAAGIYRQAFKCPRCGKWYFWTGLYHNPFARKCLHCGLRRWNPAANGSS